MKNSVIKSGSGDGSDTIGLLNGILSSPYVKILCCYLALVMIGLISFPKTAWASFISHQSENAIELDSEFLETLRTVLENELITEKFSELGLTQEEIIRRVEQLSPGEREVVLENLDTIQCGGDDLEDFFNGIGLAICIVIGILYLGYLGIKAIVDASKDKDKNEAPDSEKEVHLQKKPDTEKGVN